LAGLDACGQYVENHVMGMSRDVHNIVVGVAGRQHVYVGEQEVALIVLMQPDPILNSSDIVSEVELAGRSVTGEQAL